MSNRNGLYPFRGGVRVVPFYNCDSDAKVLCVDVRNGKDKVRLTVRLDDVQAGLGALNERIVGWPQHPVTAGQLLYDA